MVFQSSCSLIIGSVKPVEEKSRTYGILDLSKTDPNWTRLEQQNSAGQKGSNSAGQESNISDIAFQSKKTASVISINTVCKSYENGQERNPDLKQLTMELLLGISNISLRNEENILVDNIPALKTTIQGWMNNEKVMLRTIVLKYSHCIYDLMYISRPERFAQEEENFSHFISSLHLR